MGLFKIWCKSRTTKRFVKASSLDELIKKGTWYCCIMIIMHAIIACWYYTVFWCNVDSTLEKSKGIKCKRPQWYGKMRLIPCIASGWQQRPLAAKVLYLTHPVVCIWSRRMQHINFVAWTVSEINWAPKVGGPFPG